LDSKILDATEQLFAERGFSGTSVRAITDLAGANLAAVGCALPGLSPEELLFRMRGILSVTAIDRVQIYNQRPEASPSLAADEARRWSITFLAAAISAPPTAKQ
jgi:hypothetical protein